MKSLLTILSLFIVTLSATTSPTWAVNRVLSLDGDGDYVEVPDSDSLDLATGLTVEMWVEVYSLTGNVANIFLNKEDAYECAIQDYIDPQQNFGFALSVNGDWAARWTGHHIGGWYDGGERLEFGDWYHVAITYNGELANAYVDGVLTASYTAVGRIDQRETPLRIGARPIDLMRDREVRNLDCVHGKLDEVRVWSVARTQEQIRGTMNTILTGDEPGLVSYWNFDEGTANDRSNHENHGTLHGDAQIVEAPLTVVVEDRVVNPSDEFTTNISVHWAASAVHRFSFDLKFDPAMLQAVSLKEGTFLSRDAANTTEWSTPEVDKEEGIVSYIECKRMTADGVEGKGALAVVTSSAQGAGNSKIHVENLRLFSPDGEQILSQMRPGSVEVFPHGTISGVVMDAEHQTPIPTVKIEVSKMWSRLRRQVYSDPAGKYTISHIPVGNATVRAKKQGFFTVTKKVRVKMGEEISNIDFQIKLRPLPPAPPERGEEDETEDF